MYRGVMMKRLFNRFFCLFIISIGLMLITGVLLVENYISSEGKIDFANKASENLMAKYSALSELDSELQDLAEMRSSYKNYDFKTLIPSEIIWVEKSEKIISKYEKDVKNLSRLNKFTYEFKKIIEQTDAIYLQNKKVRQLDEKILSFQKYLDGKKMVKLAKWLVIFNETWSELKANIFKNGIHSLRSWKMNLQKIENILLASDLKANKKEKVLERLYFLREMTNEFNMLFALSNSYLLKKNKVYNQIKFSRDILKIQQGNIILKLVSASSFKNITIIALFLFSFLLTLMSGIRYFIRKHFSLSKKQKIKENEILDVSQQMKYEVSVTDNSEMVKDQVNKAISETLLEIASLQGYGANSVRKKGKNKRKTTKLPGNSLSN